MIQVEESIHDGLLEEAAASGRPQARVWEPARALGVLGRSDAPEEACFEDACRARGVAIVRRRGGGGAVVLAPGMVVLSLAARCPLPRRRCALYERVNARVARALGAAGVRGLVPAGVSDLAIGDRKVLGCSLAFHREHALYQGVLLVDADLELIAACLRPPRRAPEYRAGRSHREFLTTLAEAGSPVGCGVAAATLRRAFPAAEVAALFEGGGQGGGADPGARTP